MNDVMGFTAVNADEGARTGALFVYALMEGKFVQHVWHAFDSHKLTRLMCERLQLYDQDDVVIASMHVVFFCRDAGESKFYVIINHRTMRDPLGDTVEFDTWQAAENWVSKHLPHPTNKGH